MEYDKLQKTEGQSKQRERNLTGIPTQMKWDLEARSGVSLEDVRVHYRSDQPAKLGALAYTQGTQVHIGPGQEGYLRHELGHVVQQKLGLVRANARYPGGPALNTEETLERQADAIGAGAYCRPVLSAGTPPVQRCEAPVLQAAGHITHLSPVDCDTDQPTLPPTGEPVIVFEAMGVSADDCDAVYEQTKLYNGNTICVFGLNTETDLVPDGEDPTKKKPNPRGAFAEKQQTLREYLDTKKPNNPGSRHLLYTFSFMWDRAGVRGDDRGYPLPFVEARVLVMQQAANIVEQLDHSQYTFLYRWIDADAKDDTTASLDPSRLKDFAGMYLPAVMTGSYDWRSDTGGTMPNYNNFLEKFNQAERKLREYYYLLSQSSENLEKRIQTPRQDPNNEAVAAARILHEIHKNSGDGIDPAELARADFNEYLPGYYLPETTLLMNEEAHKIMAGTLPRVGDARMETALGNVGASQNRPQDKESMRLISRIHNINNTSAVRYEAALSVTKPLKNEFSGTTYWGKEMLDFLRDAPERQGAKGAFIVALKNVRQSAFNNSNWYFIKDSEWSKWEKDKGPQADETRKRKQKLFNLKRRELKNDLFRFLIEQTGDGKTRLKKISEEIHQHETS